MRRTLTEAGDLLDLVSQRVSHTENDDSLRSATVALRPARESALVAATLS
jgi:hypothetical protein